MTTRLPSRSTEAIFAPGDSFVQASDGRADFDGTFGAWSPCRRLNGGSGDSEHAATHGFDFGKFWHEGDFREQF